MVESSGIQPEPTSPPSAAPAYGAPQQPVVVKERPFIIGLLLTVVTLGIYHLFWHHLTHDELARQMGTENKAKPWWIAYIVIWLVSLGLSFAGPSPLEAGPETAEELFEYVVDWAWYFILSFVVGIASAALWIVYVVKQWDLVREAKARMGLRLRASITTFLLLTIGSFGIMILFFWLIIPVFAPFIMIPIAYSYLQGNYNDIRRALDANQVDRTAYAPGGAGWHQGPLQPPAAGPAPVADRFHGPSSGAMAHAAGPGAGAPWGQTHAPGQVPHALQTESGPSSDAPPAPRGEGFSVRDRDAPQPESTATPTASVEQSFQCPRCHAHVPARGPPGTSVTIHCTQCGESGAVRLPPSP